MIKNHFYGAFRGIGRNTLDTELIELQRGGTREFKSIEASEQTARNIGFRRVDCSDVMDAPTQRLNNGGKDSLQEESEIDTKGSAL
ncbi:hypothetical protein AB2J21_21405 [Aeromonas sp. A3]|uniref:hypothetical protein n=1 Tax=Aeromonas sp. A3 TaxID=3234190 RepID=UPI00376F7B14